MAWGSTAPAAIAGLVATLQAGMTTKVLDSAVVSDAAGQEVVNVGWQTEDQPSVDATVDQEGYGGQPDRERYTINNAVRVLNARDVVAARARAFELLGQVGAAIKADHTLGGSVMRAGISAWSFEAQQGRGGALATILFGVDCDAFTNR